ncbi:tetratricopeptide repeat protein [Aegicerativicinus sediminis]
MRINTFQILGLFILLLGLGNYSFGQNIQLFEEGNKLYDEGDFGGAVDKYEAILKTGEESAELYYNLGNAHYKLNNVAPSIYYYEKALQLNPNDSEIQNNITFAQNMTIDAIDNIPEVGLKKLLSNLTALFPTDGWALLTSVFAVLFTLIFIFYYLSGSTAKKRTFFVGSGIFISLAVVCFLFAFHSHNLERIDKPAIVFASESQVKSEPNPRGTLSFTLHAGTKVQILDTINNWNKIKLSDGKTGWMKAEDMKPL